MFGILLLLSLYLCLSLAAGMRLSGALTVAGWDG